MTTTTTPRLAWSIEEAAEQIGIGRSKFFELIKNRSIAAVKIGTRTVVPDSVLRNFLATCAPASSHAAA